MNLLDIVSYCSDPGLAQILKIIRTFLRLVQILGPIIAMVALGMNLIKLMSNPDNKKYATLNKNWLVAFVMLVLIPALVNLVMGWLERSFSIASCWNYLD